MIIYSASTGFVGSELQAYTSGTRIDRWDRTRQSEYKQVGNRWNLENIRNFNVATSDAVVSNGVPAFGQGIFAITSFHLISVIHCEKESFVEIPLKFDNMHTLCFRTKEGGA
jgi:hypothetical protein